MYGVKEVSIDELDISEWNDLLLKSEICDAFQTLEWAQALRNTEKIEPYFLFVQNKKETLGGVMFLKKKSFKILDSYEIRGGPIFIGTNRDIVMQHIVKFFRNKQNGSMYSLFIPSPLINYGFREMFQHEGYYPLLFRTVIIDLENPLENVWRALDKKARWGVRKAERLGVEVKIASSWQDWKEYYSLHVHHSREKYYSTQSSDFLKEMFKLYQKNMCHLFIAKYDELMIAGSLFLSYRKSMIFLQNASLGAFLKYNPNNLIQWRSMEWANRKGATTYDLNGLPVKESAHLRGIYEFKKRWDGQVYWYCYYLNRRSLCTAEHLIRRNFLAWKIFASLRNLGIVPR